MCIDIIHKMIKTFKKRIEEVKMSNKIEELKDMLAGYGFYPKKEEPKKTNPIVIILAVIGAIAAVAAIAYAVFYFFIPEDSEYFEDFDDDEFEDDEFEDYDLEGDE